MSDKKVQIVESAVRMIRAGGYNSFSFREIADEVGVKSSSVHYYFQRKENLAVAAAESYSEAFFKNLGNSEDISLMAKERFRLYAQVFVDSFEVSGRACLCGILSHESPALPETVIEAVNRFIDRNLEWLTRAYSSGPEKDRLDDPEGAAFLTYSALEGAMAASTLKKDVKWLRLAIAEIEKIF